MIFYEQNKSKIFALSLLVIVTTGFIGWQWLNFAPWKKVISQPSPELQQVGVEIQNTVTEVKESFSVGQDQLKDLQVEAAKVPAQQGLLEETNQYLLEKQQPVEENNNQVVN